MPVPFNKIRFENLKTILQVLKKVLLARHIDFYLIGAVARDIQLSGKRNIPSPRATADIDLAIMVNHPVEFKQLRDALINQFEFVETEQPYRYRYKDGWLVDFLPFGGIESRERVVTLHGQHLVALSAIGLMENFDHSEEIEFEGGFKIRVSTLAGICLLKFFAWAGKPYERERDINDIHFILKNYTDIFNDEIFEQHADLLESGWPDFLGARLLGRHMGSILNTHTVTKTRLMELLFGQLTVNSDLPRQFSAFNRKTISQNITMIKEIIRGVNDR